MRRVQSLILCCLFLFVGCVTDEANRYYLTEKLPKKNTSEVLVFLREPPVQPYEVIAEFQANNASAKFMQKRAAKIGADAVIVIPAGGWYSQEETWAGNDTYSNSYTRLIGIAIQFKK